MQSVLLYFSHVGWIDILSQVVINAIYSASVSTMPYLTFFFCAGLAGMAALLAFFIYPTEKISDDQEA